MRSTKHSLIRLAELYGIDRSYMDTNHARREASPETLLDLLRARGAPIETVADARNALREKAEMLACDGLEPVLVSWGGRMAELPLRLTGAAAERMVRYTIRFEDGTVRTADAQPEPILRPRRHAGAPTHRIRPVGAIPTGYHDVEVETSAGSHTSRLIAAPRRAFTPRSQADWGLFVPLYALRNPGDDGIGSYTDLARVAQWIAARGGSFVGTLPLLASYVDVCFEPSPYAPVSRLFWNELFVDVTRAPGWSAHASHAWHATHAPHASHASHAANAANVAPVEPNSVDYRTAGATRLHALRAAAHAYFAAGDTTALDRFLAGNDRVRQYARFRAVLDRRRESWRNWPDRLRDGRIDDGDFAPEDERFHCYAQWVADAQLAAIAAASERDSAGLYLDLPLGVNADGFDAWSERDLFADGASTGAPPDSLFTGGQNWGFRPPDPDTQRHTGYRYFIDSLRHHMRHARMLRLDHAMSLYRLFWIPEGADARDGAYVRYPVDELFAVLALESNRHRTAVVGEDLGTVPREIRQQMDRRRVLRMYVVQYELSPDAADTIKPVPRDVVATVNTHDMPTFRGFVLGSDLKDQRELGLVDSATGDANATARNRLVQRLAERFGDADTTRELLARVLGYLAESPARGVIINLEDLWLEDRPQNVPGTNTERDNWQRRTRFTIDEFMRDPDVIELLSIVDRRRSASARVAIAEG